MLRWIFPPTCTLCGEPTEGASLCTDCLAALPRVPLPICLSCGSPTDGMTERPDRCPACAGHHRKLNFARSALTYSPEAMRLVHDLKYHRGNHLAPALAPLLDALWGETPQLREHRDWVLVPVPIRFGRLWTRGFNQAEELALALAKRRGLPLLHALERRKTDVASQTRLSAVLRERNARRAYHPLRAYAAGKRTLPPHLLLIDDVYTTGATLRACAAALKSCGGVKTVGALTLLRMA